MATGSKGDLIRTVRAVEQVRRMRGGSQSHLMRCDDGNCYVVKFPNNPQGTRILANEFLATALALRIGLPAAEGRVVRVNETLITHSEEMFFDLGYSREILPPGMCFGSLYQRSQACAGGPEALCAYDLLPQSELRRVANLSDFSGMLVFDKWTANLDTRQVVFVMRNGSYSARMVDQGWCFGGVAWDFAGRPGSGLYFPAVVYENIRGFECFEPWLSRLDHLSLSILTEVAQSIPGEWYEGDENGLAVLIERLHERRAKVGDELREMYKRFPQYFPNWKVRTMAVAR